MFPSTTIPRTFRTVLFALLVAIMSMSATGLAAAASEQPERSVSAEGVTFTVEHVAKREARTVVTYRIAVDGDLEFEQTGIVARRANGRIVHPRQIAYLNPHRHRALFPAFPRGEAITYQLTPILVGQHGAPEVLFYFDGQAFAELGHGEELVVNHDLTLAGDRLRVTHLTKLSYGVAIRIENVVPDPDGRMMLYFPSSHVATLDDHRGNAFRLVETYTNLRKIDPTDSTVMVAGGNTLTFAGTISPTATTLTLQTERYAELRTGPWLIPTGR